MKINYETVHFNYADRIGNLTAEAVGVVKGEKHFPVYSGNRIFKPLSKSKPFSTPLFAYAEVFWSNVINEYFVSVLCDYLEHPLLFQIAIAVFIGLGWVDKRYMHCLWKYSTIYYDNV